MRSQRTTPSLKGLKVIRPGLHLGTLKKNRFEPSYALAKALCSDSMLSYETTEEEAARYLHGETLMTSTSLQGWVLVCYQGFPLGFAKATKGTLKIIIQKGCEHNIKEAPQNKESLATLSRSSGAVCS